MIRHIGGELHVLIIRDPYGKWGLPKGHLERGEESVDAALREVEEETALTTIPGPLVSTIDWYFKAKGRLVHKFCDFFLLCSRDGDAVPETAEGITECRWLGWDAAIERIDYENAREVVESARVLVAESGSAELFPQ